MSEDGGASVRVFFVDGGCILGLFKDFLVEHQSTTSEVVAGDEQGLCG